MAFLFPDLNKCEMRRCQKAHVRHVWQVRGQCAVCAVWDWGIREHIQARAFKSQQKQVPEMSCWSQTASCSRFIRHRWDCGHADLLFQPERVHIQRLNPHRLTYFTAELISSDTQRHTTIKYFNDL